MADHSKLGRTYGRRAPVSLEDMLQTTKECIVISNFANQASETIEREVAALKNLLDPFANSKDFRQTIFVFDWLISKGLSIANTLCMDCVRESGNH